MKLQALLTIAWLVTAEASGAWDGSAPYNVSGSVSVPCYDLSKPASQQPSTRPNWNLTQRLRYNATGHDISHASILLDPDHPIDEADHRTNRAIKGWDRCHLFLQGPLRNSTDPVKADCSKTLSPDCMRIIKKAGATCDTISQIDQDACGMQVQGGSFGTGRDAQFGASHKGWLGSGGVSSENLDIKSYDKEIRRPIIFYARWDYEQKKVSDDFVCFGLDNFRNNSRTLADALRDVEGNSKPNGTSDGDSDGKADDKPKDKPDDASDGKGKDSKAGKSASSVTAVSWTAGLVVLSLAL